jgi:hypothetical protein
MQHDRLRLVSRVWTAIAAGDQLGLFRRNCRHHAQIPPADDLEEWRTLQAVSRVHLAAGKHHHRVHVMAIDHPRVCHAVTEGIEGYPLPSRGVGTDHLRGVARIDEKKLIDFFIRPLQRTLVELVLLPFRLREFGAQFVAVGEWLLSEALNNLSILPAHDLSFSIDPDVGPGVGVAIAIVPRRLTATIKFDITGARAFSVAAIVKAVDDCRRRYFCYFRSHGTFLYILRMFIDADLTPMTSGQLARSYSAAFAAEFLHSQPKFSASSCSCSQS